MGPRTAGPRGLEPARRGDDAERVPAAWTHELRRRPLLWAAVAVAALVLVLAAASTSLAPPYQQPVDLRASPDGSDGAAPIRVDPALYGEAYAP